MIWRMDASLAVDASVSAALPAKVKPLLRGVSHQVGFFVALVAGTLLVRSAKSPLAAWTGAVYALSLAGLLGTSALYHRPTWSVSARALMRRCDHAAIYLLIAGTGTPVISLALPGKASHLPLVVVWSGAALGILKSLVWPKAPKALEAVLCIALGWTVVPFLPAMRALLSTTDVALLIAGGVAYSLGAMAYALRRPDPIPHVFGYHEIFHACVLGAAACHFALVWSLVVG